MFPWPRIAQKIQNNVKEEAVFVLKTLFPLCRGGANPSFLPMCFNGFSGLGPVGDGALCQCRSSPGRLDGRGLGSRERRARASASMPGWLDEVSGVFSNLLLCAVCLGSAAQTFQISRAAAAGFLLQALGPLMDSWHPLAAPLGLTWERGGPPDDGWVSTVVALPLLAFGFHWLNGDCCTANVLLGSSVLLAGSSGYFTEEGKDMVVHSATTVAAITILIVSIFTGNACGIAGSLLVGAAGLLSGVKWEQPLALRCLMAAGNLALRWALQVQDLD
uniref:Transmembrane protein 276 n=1 Tax=Salvator merianae TaxID=96440 RepID=A0A8D0BIU1_SALMN